MSVFDHHDYRDFIRSALDSGSQSRGRRSEFAKALGCQSSFISQVLNKSVHLSFDHAFSAAGFFGLVEDETRYFMNLIQKERAGSKKLETFYQNQLDEIKGRRQVIGEKIRSHQKLTSEDQAIYYSMWWYSAIHILSALPDFNTVEDFSQRLHLPVTVIEKCLDFLLKKDFVMKAAVGFKIGKTRIHVGAKSPMISRHHSNWLAHAGQRTEKVNPEDLFYSAVIGISKKDGERIKRLILENIEACEKILVASAEEAPYVLMHGFYELN